MEASPDSEGHGAGYDAEKRYERPYDLSDPEFCWLTPRPFLCRRCLERDSQFVQILEFDDAGRPTRTYVCRDWQRRYLR